MFLIPILCIAISSKPLDQHLPHSDTNSLYTSLFTVLIVCLIFLSRFNKTLSTYETLKFEKETWTLFHCLYKDRLEMEEKENEYMENDWEGEDNKTLVSQI